MKNPRFDQLPDDAQLWVYGFDRELTAEAKATVESDLEAFVRSWTSHEEPVQGAWTLVDDRFVILSGHCGAGIGGCSIDGSVGVIRSFRDKHGIDGFNRDLVFFRNDEGVVETMTRSEFQKGVEDGRFGPATVVFDLTVTTLHALREGRFETTFDNSWHARAFTA